MRLEFASTALRSNVEFQINLDRAIKLQNWLLRREWFDLTFTRRVDALVQKDQHSTKCDGEHVDGAREAVDLRNETKISTKLTGTAIRLSSRVHVPAKLLRGKWTDQRIEMLEHLLRWGATVFASPPICHRIPEHLLRSAISEANLRATWLCRHTMAVDYDHDMFRLAIFQHCNKDMIISIVTDSLRGPNHFIDWKDDDLWARVMERCRVGDPKGMFLKPILASEGRNLWLQEKIGK